MAVGIAGGIVCTCDTGDGAEAVAVGRIAIDLRGRADLGAEAVAGGVVAVAVDQRAGAAVLERCEAAEGVVAQADLRRGIARRASAR